MFSTIATASATMVNTTAGKTLVGTIAGATMEDLKWSGPGGELY